MRTISTLCTVRNLSFGRFTNHTFGERLRCASAAALLHRRPPSAQRAPNAQQGAHLNTSSPSASGRRPSLAARGGGPAAPSGPDEPCRGSSPRAGRQPCREGKQSLTSTLRLPATALASPPATPLLRGPASGPDPALPPHRCRPPKCPPADRPLLLPTPHDSDRSTPSFAPPLRVCWRKRAPP